MIKNKQYLYSDRCVDVPAHTHAGQYILDKLWAAKHTDAIINGETGERLSRGDLVQQSIDIALSLARFGVGKGQAVGICSEKRKEFMPTFLGTICTGATFAPADITCGRATIVHRINIGKPVIMFCSPSAYDMHKNTFKTIASIKKIVVYSDHVDEGDMTFKEFLTEHGKYEDFTTKPLNGREAVAIMMYSSGTTGLPKGIPVSHLGLILLSKTAVIDHRYYDGIPVLNTREWYYTYGMVFSLSCLCDGATVVYSPTNQELQFLEIVQKYQIKAIQLAPATITSFVKSKILSNYDVSSVERFISASTTCDAELIAAAQKRFPNLKQVLQLYGMTEMGCMALTEATPGSPRDGSVGHVNYGFVIKIVDLNTGETLGPNQRGEIYVRSSAFTPRYEGVVEHEFLDEEGFFKTGDVGYYDDDKYIYIVDRLKELIKFNSFQVAPAELESVLLQHAAVRDAGVVGAPHAQYGQAPTAFVVLQPGAAVTEEELVAYVDGEVSYRMRLAGGVRFVENLPRSGGGAKLDRNALKLML